MPEGAGISVDQHGLTAFGQGVENRTNGSLVPTVDTAMGSYRLGTKFGAGLSATSGALAKAREEYQKCLEQGGMTLAEYVRASELLINAIKQVQENYGSADAAAAAGNDAIIAEAMNDASAALADQRQASDDAYDAAMRANQYGAHAPTLRADYHEQPAGAAQ